MHGPKYDFPVGDYIQTKGVRYTKTWGEYTLNASDAYWLDDDGDWNDFAPKGDPFTFKDVQSRSEKDCDIMLWSEFLRKKKNPTRKPAVAPAPNLALALSPAHRPRKRRTESVEWGCTIAFLLL